MEKIEKIKECKFCLDTNNPEDLISPCYCKGSLEFVHLECLEHYHLEYDNKSDKCGICEYFYNFDNEIKYNIFYQLFLKYFTIYSINFICLFLCFNQNINYFFKSIIFLLILNKLIEHNDLKKFKYYNFKNILKNDISCSDYKKIWNILKYYFSINIFIILFYKFIVDIQLVFFNSSIKIFKYVYIFISLLYLVRLVNFIYKKSIYKKILDIKILNKKVL